MDTRERENRIQTICLLTLTTIAIGVALFFLRPVLIPFVLAVFLVYCLAPAVDAQVKYLRFKRPLAVISTILLGSAALFLVWLLIWASVSQMSENAGDYERQFQELLKATADRLPLERFGIEATELPELLQITRETTTGFLGRIVSAVMTVLSNGLLVIIFMIFLMAGSSAVHPDPGSFRDQVEHRIKRYILTKVLVSGTTGILVGLTLWMLGVELAMVFGLLAFLLNFIPNIGSVVSTLLPMPVVLLSPELSAPAKLMAFIVPGFIQFMVGNIIEPKVMGESLDLHPVVVLLGLIFFGMIWGVIGMILATPIVAVLRIVLERMEETAPVARLLAGRLGSDEAASRT